MTTPQNPAPGPQSHAADTQKLIDRYASAVGSTPRPQAPAAPVGPIAPRPPAPQVPAAPAPAPASLPTDHEDPFGTLDEDIQFHETTFDTTPPEWADKTETRPERGPNFDTYSPVPAQSDPVTHAFGGDDALDPYGQDDDFRRGVKKETPRQGWRAFVANTLRIPVSKGKAELEYDNLITLINRSLLSPKVIGVVGGKGGVGKTTTVMTLASTLASIRSKPVVAITLDYNSTLSLRTKAVSAPARGEVSLYKFATDPTIVSPNDIAGCMRNNKHRLSVLGAGLNPLAHETLTPEQFQHALARLKTQYELIVIDFGNTPNSDAYWEALKSLDFLVMVTSTENDSMQGTRLIEGMAREVGLTDLLTRRTMEIVNHRSPADPKVDLDHFVGRVQSVAHREIIEIPWDDHFSESGPVDLDLLAKETRYQFIRAAAIAVTNLPA